LRNGEVVVELLKRFTHIVNRLLALIKAYSYDVKQILTTQGSDYCGINEVVLLASFSKAKNENVE
jgi:hypothetical protein